MSDDESIEQHSDNESESKQSDLPTGKESSDSSPNPVDLSVNEPQSDTKKEIVSQESSPPSPGQQVVVIIMIMDMYVLHTVYILFTIKDSKNPEVASIS
jgi:hypothetical protein